MSITLVMPNEEPNEQEFAGVVTTYPTGITKTPDINESEPGAIEPRHYEIPELETEVPLNQLVSLQPVLALLLKTGGWTVAVLLAFRWVVVPLLAVNTPVSLTLAVSVGVFLILCGISALVREFKK